MDVIVLLNHSLFKRRCLLEDHRILIFRVGIASKAELSKTVGDIFVFILLITRERLFKIFSKVLSKKLSKKG